MKLIKITLLVTGLLFTGWLVSQTGLDVIWQELVSLGPWWVLFLLPYMGVYFFDALGWKYSFLKETRVPYWLLFKARLAGESINYTTPTAYVGGEPVKAYILSKKEAAPMPDGLASVVIGKFLMTVTEVIFILIGILITVSIKDENQSLFWGLLLFFGAFLVFLGFMMIFQQKGLGKFFSEKTRKIQFISSYLDCHKEGIQEFDKILARYYRDEKSQMFLSSAFYFLGWLCGALEIYLILYLTGNPVSLTTAFAMEAISVAIKGAGFIVPGSIGIQDGGQVWVFIFFGFSASVGVTFAILRRVREVVWIVLGLFFLFREWGTSRPDFQAELHLPSLTETGKTQALGSLQK